MNPSHAKTGLVICDHGSQRGASNELLEDFAAMFARLKPFAIVEPAHMELCEPTIEQGFRRCVERGAERVVLVPYFLAPGKHWHKDLPALAAKAAAACGNVPFLVAAPIGLHEAMADIIADRVTHCLAKAEGKAGECDACRGLGRCQFATAG